MVPRFAHLGKNWIADLADVADRLTSRAHPRDPPDPLSKLSAAGGTRRPVTAHQHREARTMDTSTTTYTAINLAEKLDMIREQWQPRVVAELNDYQFKLSRIEGDFMWHDHPETDEAFLVLDGELRIDFR